MEEPGPGLPPGTPSLFTKKACKKHANDVGTQKFRFGEGTCKENQCVDANDNLLPLLAHLTYFQATVLENYVLIEWETASEFHNLGMNLWCAKMRDNQFDEIIKLNSEFIPSRAILSHYGTSYSSTDYPYVNTNLKPGVQHCALEDIDDSGQCTLHCDQIDTTVVGKDQNVTNVDLDELNAKAIALCHQYEDSLTEAGQGGVCLDQLLISREPRLIPYRR